MKRNVLLSISLVLVLLIAAPAYAADNYYADLKISVDEAGLVDISGKTNYEGLLTQDNTEYTSKSGKYWTLNITVPQTFKEYNFKLNLPENSAVNYVKTGKVLSIEDSSGIIIYGTGTNQSFFIVVQYSISPKNSSQPITLFLVSGLAIIFAVGLAFIFRKKLKKKKKKYNLKALTERQKAIVLLLEKSKKPLTQKEILMQLNFPKSSLSRNIDSLAKRGIIVKEQKGMSNLLSLKKEE